MTQMCGDGLIVPLRLTINVWVVCHRLEILTAEKTAQCQEELAHELGSFAT